MFENEGKIWLYWKLATDYIDHNFRYLEEIILCWNCLEVNKFVLLDHLQIK